MKDNRIITSHKVYAAWEYKQEEKDLNEASKNGLQLLKGGCFRSQYIQDDSVRYIYQLDFCHPDNKARYIECFEDAGWQYINSTFNGWHYFRRPYEENVSPEDVKIYTDQESLYEMENRWINILRLCSIITLIAGIWYTGLVLFGNNGITPSAVALIIEAFIFFLLSACLFSAVHSIKRVREGLEATYILPLQYVFTIMIIGFAVGAVLILI